MLARDCSNYTVAFTPDLIAQWRAAGAGLCILQCFPPTSLQYANQRRQMDVCAQEGMSYDCYVYDYLADPTWRDGALAGLTAAYDDGLRPRKLWLDEEDVSLVVGNWSVAARINAIQASLIATDDWLAARDMPKAGLYTAQWWWGPKTGNSRQFAARELWTAQYDGVADATVFTPFGGWQSCRIKQFAGSQPDGTDMNVLSVDEEAELSQPSPDPAPDCSEVTSERDGLVSTLGYIAGDLLKPVVGQKGLSVATKRLIAGIQAQADQHGISHA